MNIENFELPELSIDDLKRLFGLTRSEARVAQHIARGLAPKQIARLFGVVPDTVRNQLKVVFSATHTHTQSSLAVLLTKTALLGAEKA
jgi:DNA-binding CsgD family transcriptional regulator